MRCSGAPQLVCQGGKEEDVVTRDRVERLHEVAKKQHPRLQLVLYITQNLPSEQPRPPGEAVLLLDAGLLKQLLQAAVDDLRYDLAGSVKQHDASSAVSLIRYDL
jgi:hypothetical protein